MKDTAIITLADLGSRNFADVPTAAAILEADPRTIRRAIAAGDIPAVKVGATYRVPTAWLRQQARVTS